MIKMCDCKKENTVPYRPVVGWNCIKCGEKIIESPIKVLEEYAESIMIKDKSKAKEIKSICLKLKQIIG